ncbi:ammonium transporter Rh type B-B [Battus philenor]|uniref:ammonium transporter Rh type B-B n=1 Tax=Battus philenor TaxID=42288 RepID=UPI0035D114BA
MLHKYRKMKFASLFIFQLILMTMFFVFVRYGGDKDYDVKGFEDVHVMIFIGFGFLMTFLKKYCYSALGFNWFLASLVVQWALLCQSFYHMENHIIYVTKKTLLEADIMSATVLISFGALLGTTSITQLLFIAIIEIAIACLNIWLISSHFQASDVGGSIAIHAFGAYFGLGVSWALGSKKKAAAAGAEKIDTSTYSTDMTAMLGSIFLWIYWPSFNSGLTHSNSEYQRALINTYLSLAAATVTTFFVSSCVHNEGKLEMVHVQNSTLAGGVAIGSVCNMQITSGGAIGIGIISGFLSVIGFSFLTPLLKDAGIRDTCGVNNLHGMPGILSGLFSVVFAYLASAESYGPELGDIFPALTSNDTGARTSSGQALSQLEALITTLVISIVGGIITGILARTSLFDPLQDKEKFVDEVEWELP